MLVTWEGRGAGDSGGQVSAGGGAVVRLSGTGASQHLKPAGRPEQLCACVCCGQVLHLFSGLSSGFVWMIRARDDTLGR